MVLRSNSKEVHVMESVWLHDCINRYSTRVFMLVHTHTHTHTHTNGQGWWPRGATPRPRPGVVPKARGGSLEKQPHVEGAVGAWVQEGLEEPSHVEGQEGRW